ncbi:MAG: prolyl oligopeptidase family serine peptidase [Candidatus Krumholzibacteria bacterium]|nr:prolyl oligopeptidase family serine peptidase [Candidatus Krumholzibacteria bacterium]
MRIGWSARILFLVFLVALCAPARALSQGDTIACLHGLALPLPKGYAEVVIAPNPVEAALALRAWKAPKAGERIVWPGRGEEIWRSIAADTQGWFADSVLAGCYVYVPVEMKQRAVMILQAKGDEIAYVNGAPRAGNPYCLKDARESWEPNFDISFLPVMLEKGRNDLIFRCGRERFKATLYPPSKPVFFNSSDVTVPDIVVGRKTDAWASIVVVNATTERFEDLRIEASKPGASPVSVSSVGVIQPLSVRKAGFRFTVDVPDSAGSMRVMVRLLRYRKGTDEADVFDTAVIPLRVAAPSENRKETFVSDIDGSVQYYGINPARGLAAGEPAALFLSLHGASVEAVNQSGSYEPKTWGHVVAPTNRRPYGFNWEEWGRLDALEVMDVVKKRYNIDEDRIYLTGHSMGGHGTWHIGSLFPDRFAAIGPSAGWISFWTYRFRGIDLGDTTAVRRMIRRSTTPSETFLHATNLAQLGVYVLHGADDDNVPVTEARSMVERLGTFHRDLVYHEQPGVGHWWDLSDAPGVDCVDWAPMFDFFARHARSGKERIREVHFLTSNPGVSARNNWLTIDAQTRQLEMSSADVHLDPGDIAAGKGNRFVGTTENVARLALDLDAMQSPLPITVEIDGQKLADIPHTAAQSQLWLERKSGVWAVAVEPSPDLKGSRRYGTFKEAFRNRPVFVFGTKGTAHENAWAFEKARYDAEKLWYQGNGSIDVVRDVDFDPTVEPDRNIILYGNSRTNAAWKKLLRDSPVQLDEARLTVGARAIPGSDLCCIFIRPRPGSAAASVGVVSGTSVAGMRLANRLPYLSPGIGLPDCTVFDPRVLSEGDTGVLMTGFFGLDWGVESGEFVIGK